MDKNKELIALAESDQTEFGKKQFSEQSPAQKVFSAVWSLESEVNNGGFSQYFFNESSETAGFVVEALQTIGAPSAADLCERAIAAAFPSGLPSNPAEISLAFADSSSEIEDALNDLDEEFTDYPDNLTELLYEFVLKHPETFGKPPFAKRRFWPFTFGS